MLALDTIMKTSYGTQSHLFFTKFWEFPKKTLHFPKVALYSVSRSNSPRQSLFPVYN